MNKTLLKNQEDFDDFIADQKDYSNDLYKAPKCFPCLSVSHEDWICGRGVRLVEFVHLADFEA